MSSLISIDTVLYTLFFFFNQKTAYEMRISDWSSDVCSSDLVIEGRHALDQLEGIGRHPAGAVARPQVARDHLGVGGLVEVRHVEADRAGVHRAVRVLRHHADHARSEEHTSELQSLMRISYAVFCLKKKNTTKDKTPH